MKKLFFGIITGVLFVTVIGIQSRNLFAAAVPIVHKDVEQLIEKEEFDKAESILLNIYLSLNDKDVTALSMLGGLYQEMGDNKKAVKILEKAVKISPYYPSPHFYLGKNYYKEMKSEEAASEFAIFLAGMEKAVDLNEEEQSFYISALDEISEIYFNFKMYDDFYAVNQRILKMLPDDQTATYNLGVYYYVYGRSNSKAYQFFDKVIAGAPESDMAKKARYAVEFMRANPDSRMAPDFDFIDKL